MKHIVMNILAATLLLCAMSTQAIPLVFTTALSGANENPANGSPGTGTATVTIDDALHTMRVQSAFSGLLGATLAAHIHCCTSPPGNTGVATTTPTFPGFPSGVTAGTYDQLFNMNDPASYNSMFLSAAGGVPAVAFANLLNGLNTGLAYFNIHTQAFAGGEIRGFLIPPQTGVPLPSTLLLLVLGLGGIAWRATRGHCELVLRRR
jgi:hypothetical protein